mmetsp:Transcript_11919/g.20704  ORF Transcript_11919/g.20704 Transcript_11919/m.20704 type:complete len:187 (+) Transcript_11919:49-609(+)
MMKLVTIATLLVASVTPFQTAEAFSTTPRAAAVRQVPSTFGVVGIRNTVTLQATDDDEEPMGLPTLPSQKGAAPKEEVASTPSAVATQASAPVASTNNVAVEEEGTSYPIDLPSPVLLAASMVLAISSTGSLFEVLGGTPTLGFGPTAALAAIGLPASLFLIYAAILKGAAETEEDDKEYNKPRKL